MKSPSKLNTKIHALENLKQIPLILLSDVCYWGWNNYFTFKINFKVLYFILYSKTDTCMQVSFTLYLEDRTISPADPWDSEKYQLGPQAESSQISLWFNHFCECLSEKDIYALCFRRLIAFYLTKINMQNCFTVKEKIKCFTFCFNLKLNWSVMSKSALYH